MNSAIDRKRIYIFVVFAYAPSIVVGLVIFFNGGLVNSARTALTPLAGDLLGLLMFAPALAHIITRAVTGEGFSNILLRPNLRRGWPMYLAALLLPALANLLGGAIYYLLFPSRFDPTMTYAREELGMIARGGATDPLPFIIIQTAYAIVMSLPTIYVPFGEEFGWRGYLQQKLMPLGPRKAVLLVGVIWGAWHWPAIFQGQQYLFDYLGEPVVGPLLWVWTLLPVSVLYGWVMLRSGSVWPAVIAHGVHNATCGLMLWFLSGPVDALIGPGAGGIVGSLGYFLIALPIFLIPGALAPAARPQPKGRTVETVLISEGGS
jgi:membrane protease YdiL (CAAX protease family)